MKNLQKNNLTKIYLVASVCAFMLFSIWTVLVKYVHVAPIGPNGSMVGLSKVNTFFNSVIGVNLIWYYITDWLSILPVVIAFVFAVVGIIQWIKRKSIFKVDYSIKILGVFYLITFGFYVLFEYLVINYRPTLINGYLEASYPSSTTLLVLTIMPTFITQSLRLNSCKKLNLIIVIFTTIFTAFVFVGRVLSGVHWFSDIIGSILLSTALLTGYYGLLKFSQKKNK